MYKKRKPVCLWGIDRAVACTWIFLAPAIAQPQIVMVDSTPTKDEAIKLSDYRLAIVTDQDRVLVQRNSTLEWEVASRSNFESTHSLQKRSYITTVEPSESTRLHFPIEEERDFYVYEENAHFIISSTTTQDVESATNPNLSSVRCSSGHPMYGTNIYLSVWYHRCDGYSYLYNNAMDFRFIIPHYHTYYADRVNRMQGYEDYHARNYARVSNVSFTFGALSNPDKPFRYTYTPAEGGYDIEIGKGASDRSIEYLHVSNDPLHDLVTVKEGDPPIPGLPNPDEVDPEDSPDAGDIELTNLEAPGAQVNTLKAHIWAPYRQKYRVGLYGRGYTEISQGGFALCLAQSHDYTSPSGWVVNEEERQIIPMENRRGDIVERCIFKAGVEGSILHLGDQPERYPFEDFSNRRHSLITAFEQDRVYYGVTMDRAKATIYSDTLNAVTYLYLHRSDQWIQADVGLLLGENVEFVSEMIFER